MKLPLKTFLTRIKRIYDIIFNDRPPNIIQDDYHSNKWISKRELYILLEYEKSQLLMAYKEKEKDMNDLLEGYNLNAFSNYEALERKHQGQLKKKQKA